MSDAAADPAPKKGVDLGALAHAIAGVCALVLGGLMYSRPWARELFALLMIVGGCQRGVFLLEAFGMGYGALAGNGASLWCHARLYRLAVGVHPCLRYALDRVYPFCHSGDTVNAPSWGRVRRLMDVCRCSGKPIR